MSTCLFFHVKAVLLSRGKTKEPMRNSGRGRDRGGKERVRDRGEKERRREKKDAVEKTFSVFLPPSAQ